MSEKKGSTVIVARTLAIMLFLLAMGMAGAKIFAGLDISAVMISGLMTVGVALMVVSKTAEKKPD
jgi:hypothetical protein